MRLLYDNKILDATLTVDSEDPYYDVENMQDTILAKVFRSLTDSIAIKISTQVTASYFAIMKHNLTEFATVTLQGNDTDVWTSPSFELTCTWKSGIIIESFAETTYNYWRIVIVDDDTSADGYIEIGSLYLGTYLQMPGMKIDQEIGDVTESQVSFSDSGQAYGSIKYNRREFKINFHQLSDSQRSGIRTMWANNRNVYPMVCLIWANRQDLETPIYCVIDQDEIKFKRNDSNLPWETSIKWREVF